MNEEEVDHQADHFAGRKVIAGRLVREFVETADEVFEDEPHLFVGHVRRVQIHVRELRDHEVEDVRLAHLLDLGLELEVLEYPLDVGRKALDVADEVSVDVVRVALELFEVERRVVVEALAGDFVQLRVERVADELAALAEFVLRDDPAFRRRQDAVEATKHRHREHHSFVLWRAIRAAEQVRDLPDEV